MNILKSELKFIYRALGFNIANAAELRASFLMLAIGMMLTNTSFIIIWSLFANAVGELNGWTFTDVVLLQGVTSFCYGALFSACSGLRDLPKVLLSGSFDKFLVTPKSVLVRLMTSQFSPQAVGDIFFGIVCFVYYLVVVQASLATCVLLIYSVLIACVAMLGISTAIFSVALYVYDGQNATDSLFQLFFSPAIMHGGAFAGYTRAFFTFIVPSLVVGTIPTELVDSFTLYEFVLVTGLALAWLAIGVGVFYKGLRRYESGNTQAFGD
jgi:ABC-2 type transport system permease protein